MQTQRDPSAANLRKRPESCPSPRAGQSCVIHTLSIASGHAIYRLIGVDPLTTAQFVEHVRETLQLDNTGLVSVSPASCAPALWPHFYALVPEQALMMAQPVILKWPNEWAVAFLIGMVIGSILVYDDVIHLQSGYRRQLPTTRTAARRPCTLLQLQLDTCTFSLGGPNRPRPPSSPFDPVVSS